MPHTVLLDLESDRVPLLYSLLRRGFMIRVQAGTPLRTILTRDLGFSGEHDLEGIQTILLDGAPVDDLQTPLPRGSSTLALSAAMPGLLGACLRREGAYAGLRGSITHSASGGAGGDGTQDLRIRLYNVLAEQWGPRFLVRGIRVEAAELGDLARRRMPELRRALREVRVDGFSVSPEALADWLEQRAEDESVELRLQRE